MRDPGEFYAYFINYFIPHLKKETKDRRQIVELGQFTFFVVTVRARLTVTINCYEYEIIHCFYRLFMIGYSICFSS